MTNVTVWLDSVPRIENAPGGLSLNLDEVTTLHIAGRSNLERADLLRQWAVELMAHADLLDVEHEHGRRLLADSAALVAEIRRDNGDIAPDGVCWACKVDDHSKHRDFNEGRCYGCSCMATTGDER